MLEQRVQEYQKEKIPVCGLLNSKCRGHDLMFCQFLYKIGS